MTKSELIQKTSEYVIGLPDKAHLTMREAVEAACPNENFDDVNFLDFSLLNEIIQCVEKTGTILDYRSHEDKDEGAPFNLDFVIRKKRLQKAQIVSNLICYGPRPEPEDAIEQRLTISSTGLIYFMEYLFGAIGAGKHPLGRQIQYSIGKEKAADILSLLADYMESDILACYATDIGEWKLTVTYPDGSKEDFDGSLCGGVYAGKVDLTEYIRNAIPIENLAVFDQIEL